MAMLLAFEANLQLRTHQICASPTNLSSISSAVASQSSGCSPAEMKTGTSPDNL